MAWPDDLPQAPEFRAKLRALLRGVVLALPNDPESLEE
jgi:hypothetical protein